MTEKPEPRATTASLAEALSAPAAVDDKVDPTGKLAAYKYVIPIEVKNRVLSATSSLSVPANERNRLYVALARAMKCYEDCIDPKIMAKWAACSDNASRSFHS